MGGDWCEGVTEAVVMEFHGLLRNEAMRNGDQAFVDSFLLTRQEAWTVVTVPENNVHMVFVVEGFNLKLAIDYNPLDDTALLGIVHGMSRAAKFFGSKSAKDSVGMVPNALEDFKECAGLMVRERAFNV